MPWQAADPGTIAQDDQGAFHVKVNDQWIPAPKGSIAQDDKGSYHVNTDSLPPPPAAKQDAVAPEPTPMLTQIGHAAMDAGGAVARGVGATMDFARNAAASLPGSKATPVDYGSPDSEASQLSAPFQHAPDVPNAVERGVGHVLARPWDDALPNAAHDAIAAHPALGAANDIAGGIAAGGTIGEIPGALGNITEAISSKLGSQNPAQAARIGANQPLLRARADGFKLTANDVRAQTNPADTMHPDADLPGPNESTNHAIDLANTHNQALATRSMAEDVKLPNTRNINPDEVQARMAQEGQTYAEVGKAIGTGRAPTPMLEHDIASAGERAADPETQAKVASSVRMYQDHFANNFDGPDAVQTVRALRNDASARMQSMVPGDKVLGATHQAIANAIEDEMMRQLPASAQDLVQAFPAARQQLAKLHELQDVSTGGQVDPVKVKALSDAGKPLSGAAASVANAASVAPESMGLPTGGAPNDMGYAPTHNGVIRNLWGMGKALVQKIPGANPMADAYQESRYGPVGGSNATPPSPIGASVSQVRPPVQLQSPPGQVSRAPPIQGELPIPARTARDEAPPAFELTHPEGIAFEPAERPLVRNSDGVNAAGNVMDRATWDRNVLDTINRYRNQLAGPDERLAAQGPVPHSGTDPHVPREPSPAQKLRAKLGEAMK